MPNSQDSRFFMGHSIQKKSQYTCSNFSGSKVERRWQSVLKFEVHIFQHIPPGSVHPTGLHGQNQPVTVNLALQYQNMGDVQLSTFTVNCGAFTMPHLSIIAPLMI
jgi:hypothetical protein